MPTVLKFGERLLPQALDDLSLATPERLYASVSRLPTGLSHGFRDVTFKDMAHCTDVLSHGIQKALGRAQAFETLCYIGIPDLRGAMVFLAGVKCGYKVFLPSPRNLAATNISLLEQTSCLKIMYAQEVAALIKPLGDLKTGLTFCQISSIDELLATNAKPYPFQKIFENVKDDPVVVLHSSGSTGFPKPITMTHGTFAVVDNERNLPTVPGRKNRDNSIWDFEGGGRFYTMFPYFHLSGFISTAVNPIFTEASSPVLGPALMPPSGALLREIAKHNKLRALAIPPSIAEQLLQEPNGLDLFRDLDFLCCTGGPIPQKAGETLSSVTELCPLYGSTEAFQVPQLRPEDPQKDFGYIEWNPHFKFEMQPTDDEADAFELVLFADASTEKTSALNHNLPNVREWRTKDLFKRHPDPAKPNLWSYYGRRDDIIVLATGKKFNPVPMELIIQGHPLLAGALIVGQGKSRAALLVEPKPNTKLLAQALIEEIWSTVEEANPQTPAHLLPPDQEGIPKENILVAKAERPFVRAGKGTIVRKLTEKAYAEEIEAFYDGSKH